MRALDLRAAGELEFVEQDESRATYAEKIGPGERRLDPIRPAGELERTVRALTRTSAPTWSWTAATGSACGGGAEEGEARARGAAGRHGDGLRLGCADGVLRLAVVQPPGGRPMTRGATTCVATAPARAVDDRPGSARGLRGRAPHVRARGVDRPRTATAARLDGLAGRDRALARRLAYGTVQRRGTPTT